MATDTSPKTRKSFPKHYRWYRAKSIKICVGCFVGIMYDSLYLRTDKDHTTPVYNAFCQSCAKEKGFTLPQDVTSIPEGRSLVKRLLNAIKR